LLSRLAVGGITHRLERTSQETRMLGRTYTLISFLAAAWLIGVALYVGLRQWRSHRMRAAAVLFLGAALWAFASAMEGAGGTLSTKLFWAKMQYVAVGVVPGAWLCYIIYYTGQGQRLTRRTLALGSIVPMVALALVWTNERHGLMWHDVALAGEGPFSRLDRSMGPGFVALLAYSYALVFAGVCVLLRASRRARRFSGWQTLVLLASAALPWLASVLVHVFDIGLSSSLDLEPLALALSAPALVWGVERVRRMDIVRGARGMVLESSSDAVVVLDDRDRIVQLNPVAQAVIGADAKWALGQTVRRVWPQWPERLQGGRASGELVLGDGEARRVYDVRLMDLLDWRVRPMGRVAVLHDITDRVRIQQRLTQQARQLERSNAFLSALSRVGARLQATRDPQQILETLGAELRKVGLACLVATLEPDNQALTARYISVEPALLAVGERLAGFRVVGYQVRRELWNPENVIDSKRALTAPTLVALIAPLMPRVPKVLLKQAMRMVGIDPNLPVVYVPLMVEGEVRGSMVVWGAGLEPDDVAPLSALGSQVASALENARLFGEERQRAEQLGKELAEREWAEAALRRSEVRYRSLFEDSPISLWEEDWSGVKAHVEQLRASGIDNLRSYLQAHPEQLAAFPRLIQVVDVNQASLKLYGAQSKQELLSAFEAVFMSDSMLVYAGSMQAVAEGRSSFEHEIVNQTLLGEPKVLQVKVQAMPGHEQMWDKVLVSVIDITERKRVERELQESLQEKEVLLQEVHHRVKNNLQVISSLLYLQSLEAQGQDSRHMLEDTRHRVRSMALVHEKLYGSHDLARLDFGGYVQSLVSSLQQSLATDGSAVQIELDVPELMLDVDQALPCGLIINELISNSLQHAFAGREAGRIHIGFEERDGRFSLQVSDDGVGLPDDVDLATPTSLGLALVRMLVEQLQGSLEIASEGGTEFNIVFPI
jgi:PAS domain S-box-containing protein